MLTTATKSLIALLITAFYICAANTNIRLNSLGFMPDKNKRASINVACTKFTVVRTSDAVAVFSGTVSQAKRNSDTNEDIYTADFSSLTQEGTYYLNVDGVGRSPDFPIDRTVYNSVYYTAMRGMYLWRCGSAVSATYKGTTFSHAACHTRDAYLDYVGGGHQIKPSLKGWHDAGDYNKYTVNAGVTLGMMLTAWKMFGPQLAAINLDIPESGRILPDYLAEIKWELDWLLTMQNSDGSVSPKVSTLDFGDFIMPEYETADRFLAPWGSAATADFVAMMAMAARIYSSYDSTYARQCQSAAVKSYNFLAADVADHAPDQSAFKTGEYGTGDSDDRLWAAAEMWESTGEQRYLYDFETRANSQTVKVDQDFDWSTVKNLGMFTYLLSSRTGKNNTLFNAVKTSLIQAADTMVIKRNNHGYGRALTDYYWGCNGAVARQTMILQIANTFSPSSDYLNTALDAIGYLFGRNNYCRSFVTGLGINPPLYPHDRRSGGDNNTAPWPGYLIGGGWPSATNWADSQASYKTNEIAINWQGGLIVALAGFIYSPQVNEVQQSKKGSSIIEVSNPTLCRLANTFGMISLPAGKFRVFDTRGRALFLIDNKRNGMVDLNTKGLCHGMLFVKPFKTDLP